MAKGIIYVMSTIVLGLIKIGKTGVDNFDSRMYNLEHNGYSNVVGLKRQFAIKVEDYDEKEALLDDIFSKSRVPNTELFALDLDLMVQLLASFEGEQVYPAPEKVSKEKAFTEAAKNRKVKDDWDKIPDGIYYLSEKKKGFGKIEATMSVADGAFIVKAGSICAPTNAEWVPEARKNAPIKDNILQADVVCNSPSTAAWVPMGHAPNGWMVWKNENGDPIDIYRKNDMPE